MDAIQNLINTIENGNKPDNFRILKSDLKVLGIDPKQLQDYGSTKRK